MRLSVTLGGHNYSFRDVREVMGKANDEKSGDRLAGVAAGKFLAGATVLLGAGNTRTVAS